MGVKRGILFTNELLEERVQKFRIWHESFQYDEWTTNELAHGVGLSHGLARNLITYMTFRMNLYEYDVDGVPVFGLLEDGKENTPRDPATIKEKNRYGKRS